MSTARARARTPVPIDVKQTRERECAKRRTPRHAFWDASGQQRTLSQLGGEVLGALSNTRALARGATQGGRDGVSIPNANSLPSSAWAKSGVPAGALANGQTSVAQVGEPARKARSLVSGSCFGAAPAAGISAEVSA